MIRLAFLFALVATPAIAQQPEPPADPLAIMQLRLGGMQNFLRACEMDTQRIARDAEAEIAQLKAQIDVLKKGSQPK